MLLLEELGVYPGIFNGAAETGVPNKAAYSVKNFE